jgi:signal transduction histidine kinase
MIATVPITEFAPAEREPIEIIHRQAGDFDALPLTPKLLNAVLNYVFILNQRRQIVFASQNVLQLVPGKDYANLLGVRPGEALNCLHSTEHASGCGTTKFCSECGAVKAILAGLAGYTDLQECRLTRIINGSLEAPDLLVYASPFPHHQETYALFCVTDISHQKRRQALERIFFHDIVNAVGGLEGMLNLLKNEVPAESLTDVLQAESACQDLREQVLAQKDLASAEQNELVVSPVVLNATLLLNQVMDLFRKHPIAQNRRLVLAADSAPVALISDGTLLKRVLGNLVKNALEACGSGETVTLRCALAIDRVAFSVHNPNVIPPPIQLQIYHRSFSTKGHGRGLGTYSVKLLAERYLQGIVSFISTPERGTIFFVSLPKRLTD